jgi:peptidyl-prolyl cis-trans isomerase A (cyclophilin A)
MNAYSSQQQLRSLQAPRLASRPHLKNMTHSKHSRCPTPSLTQALIFVLGSAGSLACESSPPEPISEPSAMPNQPAQKAEPKAKPASALAVGSGMSSDKDPAAGKFTLTEATKDLPKAGKLTATVETSLGALSCELYEDKAPITVANFVGLARGLRPFQHEGQWQKKPAYDGTTFHRVIKGFMIQGGDPSGNGSGEPGYVIPDEKWPGAHHDQRGLLCMANRGPNTNGMQFFITDAAAPHLDQSYTIFGKCGPDAIIEKLASVETYGRSAGMTQPPDRPLDPPRITKITISRK